MDFLADVFGVLLSVYIVGVIGASVYFWAKKTNRSQAPIVRRVTGFAYGLAWPVLVVMHFASKQQAGAQESERLAAESRILGEGKD